MAQPEIPKGVSTLDYEEAAATYRQLFNRDGDYFDVLMTLAENAAKKRLRESHSLLSADPCETYSLWLVGPL